LVSPCGYLAQVMSDNSMGYDNKNIVYVPDPVDYNEMCNFATRLYGSVKCSIVYTDGMGPYDSIARFMFSNSLDANTFREHYNLEG